MGFRIKLALAFGLSGLEMILAACSGGTATPVITPTAQTQLSFEMKTLLSLKPSQFSFKFSDKVEYDLHKENGDADNSYTVSLPANYEFRLYYNDGENFGTFFYVENRASRQLPKDGKPISKSTLDSYQNMPFTVESTFCSSSNLQDILCDGKTDRVRVEIPDYEQLWVPVDELNPVIRTEAVDFAESKHEATFYIIVSNGSPLPTGHSLGLLMQSIVASRKPNYGFSTEAIEYSAGEVSLYHTPGSVIKSPIIGGQDKTIPQSYEFIFPTGNDRKLKIKLNEAGKFGVETVSGFLNSFSSGFVPVEALIPEHWSIISQLAGEELVKLRNVLPALKNPS